MSSKRIKRELQTWDHNHDMTAKPFSTDIAQWVCSMQGPPNSPYEGGTYFIHVKLPSDYPFKPPCVRIMTPIYHPGFSNGKSCMNILYDNWSPALTVYKVL